MKPFDLEKALAGEPVVTRDGQEVRHLHLFNVGGGYPLYGVVDEEVFSYTKHGAYIEGKDHYKDLFMASKKRTVWVNFYRLAPGGSNMGFFYETEAAADAQANYERVGNKAYPIDIED